ARTLQFYSFARPKLFVPALEPELLAYWRRSLRTRLPALTHLTGRVGLDAGCGEGRYTYCLADEGAEVVGLDVSAAVNQAYRRNRANPRVHIVQGSIYQPPLRRGIFDFVMSTGVLHHLPDPDGGFDALDRATRIRDRLAVEAQIDPGRIEVAGFESSEPMTEELDDASRARNRRIEIRLFGTPPTTGAPPGP